MYGGYVPRGVRPPVVFGQTDCSDVTTMPNLGQSVPHAPHLAETIG